MPYRRRDKNVQHFKGGRWTVKQHCKSVKNAEAAIRILEHLEARE